MADVTRDLLDENRVRSAVEAAHAVRMAQPRASLFFCAEQGVAKEFAIELYDSLGRVRLNRQTDHARMVAKVEAILSGHH